MNTTSVPVTFAVAVAMEVEIVVAVPPAVYPLPAPISVKLALMELVASGAVFVSDGQGGIARAAEPQAAPAG